MPEDILVQLSSMVWQHPWWHARASLMLALLRRMDVPPSGRILDAGCGWGVNLAALENGGYHVVGLDISRRTLEQLDRPDRNLIEADLTQPLPKGLKPFDAVIALDVIEHLDDDRAVVSRLAQLTKPGGVVIVSVPAMPELYSEFDAVQGHRRRYVPGTLRQAFSGADLHVEILWWGSWMVPLLRRWRKKAPPHQAGSSPEIYKRYLTVPHWPVSILLRIAFAFEQVRVLRGKTATGTSLFAIARRST